MVTAAAAVMVVVVVEMMITEETSTTHNRCSGAVNHDEVVSVQACVRVPMSQ